MKESSTWSHIRCLVAAGVQAEVGSIVVVRQPGMMDRNIEVGKAAPAEVDIGRFGYLDG
jgi:hypothetical protein